MMENALGLALFPRGQSRCRTSLIIGICRVRKPNNIRFSRCIGGDQIDYADERPEVRTMFAQELAKNGLTPKMDAAYQAELVELPAKVA